MLKPAPLGSEGHESAARHPRRTEERDNFLLQVSHLSVEYHARPNQVHRALNDLTFAISAGEVIGIIGESGSGKSTLALALLRLLPECGKISTGSILFQGHDLLQLDEKRLQSVRGSEMALISQEPAMALNPCLRVGDQICEVMRAHRPGSKIERRQSAEKLLLDVGLTDVQRVYSAYPHELSGGQQQRVAIAQALSCSPALLIADEPTSALDVTTQAELLVYLKKLKSDLGRAILMITHDIATLAGLADRVFVLHAGELVEEGSFARISKTPRTTLS